MIRNVTRFTYSGYSVPTFLNSQLFESRDCDPMNNWQYFFFASAHNFLHSSIGFEEIENGQLQALQFIFREYIVLVGAWHGYESPNGI